MNAMISHRNLSFLRQKMTSSSFLSRHFTSLPTQQPTPSASTPQTKPRVIILGSGWGGYTMASRLSKSHYDVRVISPANHFLFTPLLPSTAVGTLEFRAIQEVSRWYLYGRRHLRPYLPILRHICISLHTSPAGAYNSGVGSILHGQGEGGGSGEESCHV
jgi:hypothetical protein